MCARVRRESCDAFFGFAAFTARPPHEIETPPKHVHCKNASRACRFQERLLSVSIPRTPRKRVDCEKDRSSNAPSRIRSLFFPRLVLKPPWLAFFSSWRCACPYPRLPLSQSQCGDRAYCLLLLMVVDRRDIILGEWGLLAIECWRRVRCIFHISLSFDANGTQRLAIPLMCTSCRCS